MSVGMVLLNIDIENGTPSTHLGPKMGMEATSLSRTIKNMEDEGLIVRKADGSDGRKSIVHLTSLGLDKRNIAKQVVLNFNETVRKELKDSDIQTFQKVLNIVNKTIKNIAWELSIIAKHIFFKIISTRYNLLFLAIESLIQQSVTKEVSTYNRIFYAIE